MAKFKFAVFGQHLNLLTPTRGLSDEYLVYSCRVDFHDDSWDGMDKWIHFVSQSDPDHPILVNLDENDEVLPERDLRLSPGVWDVFIHGDLVVNDMFSSDDLDEDAVVTKRLVTNSVGIKIEQSGIVDNEVFPDFNQTVSDDIENKSDDCCQDYIRGVRVRATDTVGVPMISPGIGTTPESMSVDLIFNNLVGNTVTGITLDDTTNRGRLTVSTRGSSPVVFTGMEELIDMWTYYTFADDGEGHVTVGIQSV